MAEKRPLSEKVVIVTGAGHGIGEAAARELATHGATIVVNDLGTAAEGGGTDEEPAQQTAQQILDEGGEAMAHFGDVSSLDYTQRLVDDTLEKYGRIDGVANFAGIMNDAMCYRLSEEQWDDVIRVHMRGHFALLRKVAAHWRELAADNDDWLDSQRSFLCVSSRSALGVVGQVHYSAAKSGVLGLTRTAARELARFNIRVNALMPSAYTRMVELIPEKVRPFGEEMSTEKIAPMAAYLMSDHAEDIMGCTIRAAGDQIGIVSDPEVRHVGYKDGGWSLDGIADRFREDVAGDVELNKTAHLWLTDDE